MGCLLVRPFKTMITPLYTNLYSIPVVFHAAVLINNAISHIITFGVTYYVTPSHKGEDRHE